MLCPFVDMRASRTPCAGCLRAGRGGPVTCSISQPSADAGPGVTFLDRGGSTDGARASAASRSMSSFFTTRRACLPDVVRSLASGSFASLSTSSNSSRTGSSASVARSPRSAPSNHPLRRSGFGHQTPSSSSGAPLALRGCFHRRAETASAQPWLRATVRNGEPLDARSRGSPPCHVVWPVWRRRATGAAAGSSEQDSEDDGARTAAISARHLPMSVLRGGGTSCAPLLGGVGEPRMDEAHLIG